MVEPFKRLNPLLIAGTFRVKLLSKPEKDPDTLGLNPLLIAGTFREFPLGIQSVYLNKFVSIPY